LLRPELGAAFALLTRLPVVPFLFPVSDAGPAQCVWAYPLVGAVVGGIGAGSYTLLAWAGLPPALSAAWALAVTFLATGALHEDGLADTADGFGGGANPERKLAIMRDSRIGSYGALALLVSTAVRWAAATELGATGRIVPALIAAGALSRGALAIPLLALRPAREDGLAAPLRDAALVRTLLGPALALALAFTLLPSRGAACAVVLTAGVALTFTVLARRQVGGYTGDVLGACAVLVECVVLSGLAA